MPRKHFRCLVAVLMAFLLTVPCVAGGANPPETIETGEEDQAAASLVDSGIPAKSAILMEQTTGRVLFEKDADEQMPPASITKVMTLLLVCEAIESGKLTLEDKVTCSPHASSMGGTQIWFEPGEQMTVDELLRATAIASANDASVALGEQIAGSEEGFVELMNQRAKELGMNNTTFKNATGLDEEGHVTTARDIAIMSRELLKHDMITKYTTTWMDELRGGKTQLVNTNKLVRFYDGATGLKTGTTSDAGYCLSASATRKGLSLVAVVLGAKSSDDRFGSARGLLDYGFANFESKPVPAPDPELAPIKVLGGVSQTARIEGNPPDVMLIEKGTGEKITQKFNLDECVIAPVEQGQKVGTIQVLLDGVLVCEYDVVTAEPVEKMTFPAAFLLLLKETVKMA